MKRFIVKILVGTCTWKDGWFYRLNYPFVFPSILSSCKLAGWSAILEDRWETGVWKKADDESRLRK